MREVYALELTINRKQIKEVVIDGHYKDAHPDINTNTILKLVSLLNGRLFKGKQEGKFEYFRSEMELENKLYRLIWILEKDRLYVGVVNAYRINKRSD